MWLTYLAAMAIVDLFIYTNQPSGPVLGYYLVNGLPALVFMGLAYSRRLWREDAILAPLMIALVTLSPILVNYAANVHLPPAPLSNLEGMMLRQLPVLFIGLVLVAWRYNLTVIILYSLTTNLLELGVAFGFAQLDRERQTALYFTLVIRTVCQIVAGIFINQLIRRLRSQQESLRAANLQLAHYASTLEDLTVSRERNRMSRELHDTVVHTLSGLSVQLETAQAYLDIEPQTARQLVEQSLEATRSGLQETRRALKSLRASPLEDLGLVQAIRSMGESAAQRGQLSLELSLPEHDPLVTPDVEQCLYRVAQEALQNVVHHARAGHIWLRLSAASKELELMIVDDGVGFPTGEVERSGHYGLAGMRERARLAGGNLTISSVVGSGTTVRLVIGE